MAPEYPEILLDICRGYSISEYKKSIIYLKHFGLEEQVIIDKEYNYYLNRAIKEGLPKKEDVLKNLKKGGFISEDYQEELNNIIRDIDQLKIRKKTQFLPSKIEKIDKEINEKQLLFNKKENEINALVGNCAEFYASQKLNDVYIQISFYKDKKLETPLFTKSTYNDEDVDDITDLLLIHRKSSNKFDEETIKKLALQEVFLNFFFLSENNIKDFLGRNIYEMTFNQIKLMSYGKYFRTIFENNDIEKIPDDVKNDPDKLIDYVTINKNANVVLKRNETNDSGNRETIFESTAIIGAKKSDIETLQDSKPTVDLFKKARENGGVLDMADMLKLVK